jgi:hypothetical protein
MKPTLLLASLLFVSLTSVGQSVVYQLFEADTAAG